MRLKERFSPDDNKSKDREEENPDTCCKVNKNKTQEQSRRTRSRRFRQYSNELRRGKITDTANNLSTQIPPRSRSPSVSNLAVSQNSVASSSGAENSINTRLEKAAPLRRSSRRQRAQTSQTTGPTSSKHHQSTGSTNANNNTIRNRKKDNDGLDSKTATSKRHYSREKRNKTLSKPKLKGRSSTNNSRLRRSKRFKGDSTKTVSHDFGLHNDATILSPPRDKTRRGRKVSILRIQIQ